METSFQQQKGPLKKTCIDALLRCSYEFDLRMSIYILQSLLKSHDSLLTVFDSKNSKIRFKSQVVFHPTPCSIYKITKYKKEEDVFIVWNHVLPIGGIYGPLPLHYSQRLLLANKKKKGAFQNFLDIFHQRSIHFWYSINQNKTPSLTNMNHSEHPQGRVLANLLGNMSLFPEKMNRFLGRYRDFFWCQTRSREGLTLILSTLFRVPIRIEEFQGGYAQAQEKERSRIGAKEGIYNVLGYNFIVGSKTWTQMRGIRIHVGPLSFERYMDLLPIPKTHFDDFVFICRYFVGINLKLSIALEIDRREIRSTYLGKGSSLGFTTWLHRPHREAFDRYILVKHLSPINKVNLMD